MAGSTEGIPAEPAVLSVQKPPAGEAGSAPKEKRKGGNKMKHGYRIQTAGLGMLLLAVALALLAYVETV